MTTNWFIVRDAKENGPYTAQQLKQMAASGKLHPDDKVRRSDMKAATKASTIKGLFAPVEPAPTKSAPSPATATAPPPAARKGGTTKKPLIIGAAVGGACLLLCCGGLGVIGTLLPTKPDAAKKELAHGAAASDKGSRAEADQQDKPGSPPHVIKLLKGGYGEPLELRVLATDEIEIVDNARDGRPSLNGFILYFDIHWRKPVDKQNPSWPWRYTIYNKKGGKIGEGGVGTRDKAHRPYDPMTQSGQTVMSRIELSRDNYEQAARIDIHRGDTQPSKQDAGEAKEKQGTAIQPSGSGVAEVWKGGTVAEFISQMRQLAREEFPRVDWLTFDPALGKVKSLTHGEAAFSKRFGPPSQNVLDSKKAERSNAQNRDRFRLWTYECKDGTITLHVEPTHIQSKPGNWDEVLAIAVDPADCVRKDKR